MQSKCLLRVVDDDIESTYKNIPDIFDFLYKVVSVFASLSKHHREAAMVLV